ncbi:MAG: hypothetical protein AB1668_07460 [Nanoarchaeota archaeon]
MRNPNKKQINKLTPILLYQPIIEHLMAFEGDFYYKSRPCPHCHSCNCKKHKVQSKLFCKVIVGGKFRDIIVFVQVFYCKDCHRTYLAESPFYESALYCQPVVDLSLYLSAKNPYHRTEKIALEFGIQIDRDTVRNYALQFEKKVKKYAGLELFGEVAGINLLKLMFDVENVKELKKKFPHEKYDGVCDETYPTIKGAKKKFKKINKERKLEGKEPFKYPKGFTLAVGYLALLKLYASLLINEVAFCQIFSKILLLPLFGADFVTTDKHGAYNIIDEIMEHLYCLLHKAKNLSKHDETLKKMKKDKKPPDEINEYLKKKYKELEEEALKEIREKFPEFFDEKGKFLGALTTNAIEGGNWRIKHELRTSYGKRKSITSRTILICLMDSIFTFRKGKPCESFAHKNTLFSFGKVMRG